MKEEASEDWSRKLIAIETSKEDYGETLGFGMMLRKHLDSYFVESIEQSSLNEL